MKKLTILSLSAAVALTAAADVLTPEQALERLGGAARARAMEQTVAPVLAHTVKYQSELPQLYVFATGSEGFMVLSAESETEALLGYSDTGAFDADNMAPGMKVWMECMAASVNRMRANAEAYDPEVTPRMARPLFKPVEPICTTLWNQNAPYNNSCPKLNNTACWTGCVATAGAQVIKTYRYPEKCSGGTYNYVWKKGGKNLSLNFNNVELKWDDMLDKYGATAVARNKEAVANLMYALGVSVEMDYGTDASGASDYMMAVGLVRNFGYDPSALFAERIWYTLPEFETLIYNEIAQGHPVYFTGANPDLTAAHAFVLDGYSADGYFHVNWGWGGTSDGYFLVDALDPADQGIGGSAAGYTFLQGALLHLKPLQPGSSVDNAPITMFAPEGYRFAASKSTGTKGLAATFTGGIYNGGSYTIPTVLPALKFISPTGKVTYAAAKSNFVGTQLTPNRGWNTITVPIPEDLNEVGDYLVSPACTRDGVKFYDAMEPIGGAKYVLMTTTEGSKTVRFSAVQLASITFEDAQAPSTIYRNTTFSISATAVNASQFDFYGAVTGVILNASGSVVKKFSRVPFSCEVDEDKPFVYSATLPSSFNTGSYFLALVDDNGKLLSEKLPVTIGATAPTTKFKATATSLKVVDAAQNNLTFSAKLSCTDGYFAAPLYVKLATASGTAISDMGGIIYSAAKGDEIDVTLVGSMVSGTPGTTYKATLCYWTQGTGYVALGSAITFTLGKAGIKEIAAEEAEGEYFDLQGRRVAQPAAGNVYLLRRGTEVTKMLMR